jgi:hypothetical protein
VISVDERDAGSYSVVVSNVYGNVSSPTAALMVVVPLRFTSIAILADRSASLWLTGAANGSYRIDASTDLSTWALLTNLANSNGALQFVDRAATNFSQRFYRATRLP